VTLTPAQRSMLNRALDAEDLGIAGMLLLGTPLREIATASGLGTGELGDRIGRMLVRLSVAHGPAVTFDASSL
jgi:hypothetical protein